MWLVSISLIFGPWDGLKNAIVHVCIEHVNHMENCKEAIRTFTKDCGFQNR